MKRPGGVRNTKTGVTVVVDHCPIERSDRRCDKCNYMIWADTDFVECGKEDVDSGDKHKREDSGTL